MEGGGCNGTQQYMSQGSGMDQAAPRVELGQLPGTLTGRGKPSRSSAGDRLGVGKGGYRGLLFGFSLYRERALSAAAAFLPVTHRDHGRAAVSDFSFFPAGMGRTVV